MSQKQTALSDVDAFGRAVYAYFAYCTVDWNNTVNVWILTPHRFAANSRPRADSVAYLRRNDRMKVYDEPISDNYFALFNKAGTVSDSNIVPVPDFKPNADLCTFTE